jgi:hypothetical protein
MIRIDPAAHTSTGLESRPFEVFTLLSNALLKCLTLHNRDNNPNYMFEAPIS